MTNQPINTYEVESLPLRPAYGYLIEKGLSEQVAEIKQSKDKYKSYTSTLKRGKILVLLEKNNLLGEFIEKHWSFGKTEKGKRKIQRYKRILEAYYNSAENEEEENEEETSFAYEEDLKNYLSKNLNVIEPGLTIFKDEHGKEGVEYSVDSENKRIDILAIDKNKTPVVIELKVSRGYEKVIGQSLYYKNRIRELLNASRVRVVIIAREITPQLKIATTDLSDIELFEYNLDVKLRKV